MILTQNGKACCSIVLGSGATWLETHTAQELREYVEKISGARIPVIGERAAEGLTGGKILIGRPETNAAIRALEEAKRTLPPYSEEDNDCIAILSTGETLVISGSNDRSVHYSACHLLQTQFGVGFYFDGDSYTKMPDLAVPDMTLIERSPFRFRHTVGQWVYNFGAFLNAQERRDELDMYARNKINSYRFYNWNTYVRKRTFQKMGVPTEPVTQEDLERIGILRETAEYARKLGIEIMVALMVETTPEFAQVYPDARYFGCEWVKDDDTEPETVPHLYPEDPVYKKLVQTFAETWIEAVGPVRHFCACPPSEHHISARIEDFIDVSVNFSKYTYEALRQIIPDARFFFDGWGVRANTPPHIWTMPGVMERFVDSLPQEVYFLDLWPNRKESVYSFREPMYRDKNYGPLKRSRYILEVLNEFGGDDHMHGDFERHIRAAQEMTDPAVVEHAMGFGNCTELCGVSLHFFDLIFWLAWNPAAVSVEDFLKQTALRRYGAAAAPVAEKALAFLQKAVYSELDSSHARYQKRCYLTRTQRRIVPLEESKRITELLEAYMETMKGLADGQKNRFAGRDMFDVVRQYITEYFNMHLQGMFGAFLGVYRGEMRLKENFEQHAALLDRLLDILIGMTREDTASYVEEKVQRFSGRPCDPDVSGSDCSPEDFRAWMRDLGTTFAKTIPNLVDYPSRDYYELIEGYYQPRIRACIGYLRELMRRDDRIALSEVDDELERRYKRAEQRWIEEGYPVTEQYRAEHLPLWRAAQNAWEALKELPLAEGLDSIKEECAASEQADVFAGGFEDADAKKERSWVSENPYEKAE